MYTFLETRDIAKLKGVDSDICYCLVKFKDNGVELVNNAVFSDRELLERYIDNYCLPDDVSILPMVFYFEYAIYDEDEEDEDDKQ